MDERIDERAIFLAALELAPADRDAFLRGACPDEETRQRIEQLLRNHVPEAEASPASMGEFKVIRKIGGGGMGVVYLAEDTVLGRKVALKLLTERLDQSETAVTRFFREARAAAQLRSPGIVQVYRYGEDSGRHYIAMEFVEGVTLGTWLNRARGVSVEGDDGAADEQVESPRSPSGDAEHFKAAARIIADVAAALEVAHSNSPPVIHRDIKPANILIDENGAAKITDFGIAMIASEEPLTEDGLMPGTPHYMSPEQAAASEIAIDHRSDIFSLGVVLYELLTFRRPFDGATSQQVIEALRTREPPSIRSVNRAVPRDLATICHKAIEKRPSERYQSAVMLAADLRCFLRGAPILASPPGPARRVRRWAARHPGWIASTAIVLLLCVVASLAAVVRADRIASLGMLIVGVEGASGRPVVYVMAHEPDSRAFGPARSLGRAPIKRRLTPGAYRVVIKDDAAGFAEFDLVVRAGERSEWTAPLMHAPQDAAAMIQFPAGVHEVRYRAWDGETDVTQTAPLRGFLMDAAEVSNREYHRFLQGAGRGRREPECWLPDGYDETIADLPVCGVSWQDAQAYAISVGKRLPTLEEWMAAARSPDARPYPWGESPAPARRSSDDDIAPARLTDVDALYAEYRRRARPVDSDPHLSTPAGLHHMFGNVAEFTGTFRLGDSRSEVVVVTVGSHWLNPFPERVDLGTVLHQPLDFGSPAVGFRCVRSAASPVLTEEQH